LKFVGRLGREYNVEQGREAARLAALNVLSAARNHLGSLNKVTRVVRLVAYLATEGDFLAQPKVADAASELLREVFGEDKLPVRMILGVASLPLGYRSCWRPFSKLKPKGARALAPSFLQRMKLSFTTPCRF
jgi:enamine deaminase RidA (YjgF/YER057c/UK114 family)